MKKKFITSFLFSLLPLLTLEANDQNCVQPAFDFSFTDDSPSTPAGSNIVFENDPRKVRITHVEGDVTFVFQEKGTYFIEYSAFSLGGIDNPAFQLFFNGAPLNGTESAFTQDTALNETSYSRTAIISADRLDTLTLQNVSGVTDFPGDNRIVIIRIED